MPKRVLLTGGAGFIGHHMVDHLLRNTDWKVIILDRLDCSGSLRRFQESDIFSEHRQRCLWVWHDFKASLSDLLIQHIGPIDYILHLGASSHVDRSIRDPMSFVMDNVVGTCNMLDFARWNMQERPGCRFLYFSTDEVFGPASPGHPGFREWDRYNCRNPYAASKAGGEELTLAFGNTYGLKILITHTMNVIGERQHPEKYVPSTIRKVLDGEEVVIHSDPTETIPGSRFYIHARNVASAVLFLLLHGEPGEKYNIVGEREVDNLQMAVMIAHILNRPLKYRLVNFHSSRPGHDLRYALSGKRMQDMGWSPPVKFEESLTRTVEWSVRHPQWL